MKVPQVVVHPVRARQVRVRRAKQILRPVRLLHQVSHRLLAAVYLVDRLALLLVVQQERPAVLQRYRQVLVRNSPILVHRLRRDQFQVQPRHLRLQMSLRFKQILMLFNSRQLLFQRRVLYSFQVS